MGDVLLGPSGLSYIIVFRAAASLSSVAAVMIGKKNNITATLGALEELNNIWSVYRLVEYQFELVAIERIIRSEVLARRRPVYWWREDRIHGNSDNKQCDAS